MITKLLRALLDWLCIPHGYLPYKRFTGSKAQVMQTKALEKALKGRAKEQVCKRCGEKFWAVKTNDTCQSAWCFFVYRMRS